MHEAKTHLSRLVALALSDEDVVIARRQQPLVRLQVFRETNSARSVGALRGMVLSMGDGFDESMEDWEGEVTPKVAKPGRALF